MSISPIVDGILRDFVLRGGFTSHRMRDSYPGINQETQDDVIGKGSANYEEPHGNS